MIWEFFETAIMWWCDLLANLDLEIDLSSKMTLRKWLLFQIIDICSKERKVNNTRSQVVLEAWFVQQSKSQNSPNPSRYVSFLSTFLYICAASSTGFLALSSSSTGGRTSASSVVARITTMRKQTIARTTPTDPTLTTMAPAAHAKINDYVYQNVKCWDRNI